MSSDIHFKLIRPDPSLEDFVYSFTSFENVSDFKDGVIIPNGRIDLIFSRGSNGQFQISLIGLETKPKLMPGQNIASFFAISFNPLAVEYILKESIAPILNAGKIMEKNFWGFASADLDDFEAFCAKASQKIKSLLPEEVDERKRKLFELIFATHGEIQVKELAEKVYWSERQISRYFQQQLGIPLKSYCKILRFQASLHHIKEGKLAPQLNFTDQSHFIKEIRQFSGVSPKELFKNQNDRFLQFQADDPA